MLPEHRVNAGFLVLERAALGVPAGDDLEHFLGWTLAWPE